MPPVPVVLYPSPDLAKACRRVDGMNQGLQDLIRDMGETARALHLEGLAAPQVGVGLRIFVMRLRHGLWAAVNPVLTGIGAPVEVDEGCPSFPGETVKVLRYPSVRLSYQTVSGAQREDIIEGDDAQAVQHFVDHLDGKTLYDYAGPVKRELIRKRLRQNAGKGLIVKKPRDASLLITPPGAGG